MRDEYHIAKADVTGFVLCGGRSSRFGSSKAHYVFEGTTLVDRSIRLVDPFVTAVWLGIGDRTGEDWPDTRLVHDVHRGIGPLAGLSAGLSSIVTEWILALPVDLPFLERDGIAKLLDAAQPGDKAVVALDDVGRHHQLVGLYHRSVGNAVSASIERHELSVRTFLSSLKSVRYVTLPRDQLRNVNRPQDLC